MHTPISPSPAPLAPGGAAAPFSLLRGLAESAKELTAENKRTYMGDYARFVEASGPAAVLEVLAAFDAATARAEAFGAQVRKALFDLFGPLLYVGPGKDPVELSQQVRYELAQIVRALALPDLPTGHTYPAYIVEAYHKLHPGAPLLGKMEAEPLPAAPSPGRGDGKEVAPC